MSTLESPNKKPAPIGQDSFWMKYLVSHLYLLQGFFYGFFRSIPLTYTRVPDYKILSMFDMATLPFSCKFIMAPLEQRFTSKRYGRRKTWIVISIALCGIFLSLLSLVVGKEDYQVTAAVLLFLCILATAFKDVSADALAVEQIHHTATISLAQFSGEELGRATTLSLFLALISNDYWAQYGRTERIMPPQYFLRIIVVVVLISGVLIHFLFEQKQNQVSREDSEQQQLKKTSMWQIMGHYKHFIMPQFSLFRQGLALLLTNHGIMYFIPTLPIELMKTGIDRQTLMFVQNLCLVPNILGSFVLSRHITHLNIARYMQLLAKVQFGFALFIYLSNFEGKGLLIGLFGCMKIISSLNYYVESSVINQTSKGRFSGITITVLLSVWNFSRNTAIQKQMIYIFGYHPCVICGFVYAAVAVMILPWVNGWIRRGQSLTHLKVQ